MTFGITFLVGNPIISEPILVGVLHGTASPIGRRVADEIIAATFRRRPTLPVRAAFLDVAEPRLADVLDDLAPAAAVVVPVLLSGGYHVRTDIPALLNGRPAVSLTPALGPAREISVAVAGRLAAARGSTAAGDLVALVSAGSSDPLAQADLDAAARDLADLLERPVEVAVLSGPGLRLADLRVAHPGARLEVAAYLLAPGAFADRLAADALAISASCVSKPIGAHPAVIDLILNRYDALLE